MEKILKRRISMKTLFSIPTLSYLRGFLDKPKEPTVLEVSSLLEELKALSDKIDIELPGVERFTFASVTFGEPATLEMSKSKLLIVDTPTATSRPGKAFWSVRTKPAKISDAGEISVDAKFELEEALFKIDKVALGTLLAASKQGRPVLESVLKTQYEARIPLRQTEQHIINMVRTALRCDIDRYHPYVHWTVEAIKERTPDLSGEAIIIAGIAKKFKDVYSQLHVSHHVFNEPRYHTVIKRKIEEGARLAWRDHLLLEQMAPTQELAQPGARDLLHHLTGFLFKPKLNTPENIKSAFDALKQISHDQDIYVAGDAYTDVGNVHFHDKHAAHLKIHAGNMYVELTKKSNYPTYADVIPAEVSDKGLVLGISKSLATEYQFEVTPATMRTLLEAHMLGEKALSDWVREQEVSRSTTTLESPTM